MAKILSFDDGLVEYEINGKATARFNPTDAAFVERLYQAFTDLDDKQEEFQARVSEIGADGAEMRKIIDGLLGEGVADALFPDMNCYALADGLPVWINLLFAVAEEIEAAYHLEQGKTDPRIKAYNARYAGMMKKYQRQ